MRPLRVKVSNTAYYHVTSRAIERRFIFDALAAEMFVRFMREVEAFTGVQVVTYCIMSNHIHLLLRIPARATVSDDEMLKRLERSFSAQAYARFKQNWERMKQQGSEAGLDTLRQGVLQRMYDLSFFMKELKYRFSIWFNRREKRRGPVWEDRFRSSLIEDKPGYLATAAAYIDNNPVRAGIVTDAKDFRFCGYASALAGDPDALAGLAVLTAAYGVEQGEARIVARYRVLLYGKGEETETTAGYSREAREEVLRAHGELKPWKLVAHRLRWLSDGAVIGSKGFVSEMRTQLRKKLRLKRASGAYASTEGDAFCSLRALRNG